MVLVVVIAASVNAGHAVVSMLPAKFLFVTLKPAQGVNVFKLAIRSTRGTRGAERAR